MCRRILCTLFAVLALFASTTWADSQIRIVRLSYVEGDVRLDRNDSDGYSKAFLNLPVVQSSRLMTGSDGYAEVEFEDGSTVRLTPNSEVEFPELGRSGETTKTVAWLHRGELYLNLRHSKNDDFSFRVGSDLFYPQKKSHLRIALKDEQSIDLAMFDGDLEMRRPNGERVN